MLAAIFGPSSLGTRHTMFQKMTGGGGSSPPDPTSSGPMFYGDVENTELAMWYGASEDDAMLYGAPL